jgi:hypothetical protein
VTAGYETPPETVAAIVELLKQGYFQSDIAKRFGMVKSTVNRIAKRSGVEYRRNRVTPRGGKRSRAMKKPDALTKPMRIKAAPTGVIAGPSSERAKHFRGHAHSLNWWAEW